MDIEEALMFVAAFKRFECRDLTFGDTEIFLEDEFGSEVGGGYFSLKGSSIWFKKDDIDYSFSDKEASRIRESIKLVKVSRNDNEGVW